MSIVYERGCLIKALKNGDVDAIAHQTNCFNTMGSGVALAVKQNFPEAYEKDCETIKGDRRKLGGFTHVETFHGLVFNLYGQYNYGKDGALYTSYNDLQEAMENMALKLSNIGFSGKIGLPLIGAGTGGGDWNVIERIIMHAFKDYVVVIYTL